MIKEIYGYKKRDIFYYDTDKLTLTDKEGNLIKLYESLEGISENNIRDTVYNLFHDLYKLQNLCKDRCKEMKKSGIEWGRSYSFK